MPKNIVIALLAIALAIAVGGVLASDATRIDMRLWQSTSDPFEVWLKVRHPDEKWMTHLFQLGSENGNRLALTDSSLMSQQSAFGAAADELQATSPAPALPRERS